MLKDLKNGFSSPLSNHKDLSNRPLESHLPEKLVRAETAKTLIEAGEQLEKQGELEQALSYYHQAVEREPNLAQAHEKLARAWQKQGDLPQALIHYRQAIALKNAQENAQENLVPEEKSSEIQGSNRQQDRPQSTTMSESNLVDLSSPLLKQQHSPANGQSKTQSSFLLNKSETANSKLEAGELYLQQALAYSDTQKWPEVIKACQQAVEIIPDSAEAYKLWGNALQRLGQTESAIGMYAKAVEIEPDLAEVYANVGSLYARKQKWSQAREYYQKAIIINPNFPGAYRNLAKVWKQLGETEKAAECHNQSLSLESQGINPEAYLISGDLLIGANEPERAIEYYLQAIKLAPDLQIGYQKIAETWEKLGQWQEAATYYRQMAKLEPKPSSQPPQLTGNGKTPALPSQQSLRPKLPVSRKTKPLLQASPDVPSQQNTGIENKTDRISKLDLTITKYEQQAQQVTDSAPLQANLGSLYAQKQEWHKALSCYQKAIKLNPNLAGVYRNLAKVLGKLEREAEAAKCWYQALTLEPQSANAEQHYHLGDLLLKQNQLEEALVCYRQAISLKPDYAQAHFRMGEILQGKKRNQEAINSYRQAIQCNPKTIVYYHSLGQVLVQQHKWDEAISLYQQVLEFKPNCWETYDYLGEALHKAKRTEEAILAYQMGSEAQPDKAELQVKLGSILVEQEQWEQALDCYRQALEVAPKSCSVYLALGEIFLKQEQLDKAISAYRQAVELEFDSPLAYKHLGDALSKKGHLEQAIICFKKVIQAQPNDFRAYYFLGTALCRQGHLEKALVYLRQVIECNPNFAPAYHLLGEILLQQSHLPQQLDEAVTHLRRAIELQRDYYRSYYCLGYALAQQKKFDIAIICYRQAIKLEPKFAGSYCYLGHALAEAGKPHEAAQYYLKALEIEPNLNFADNHLVKINFNINSILYPLWDGEDIAGKRLLVHTGKDLGEAIRLIPYLKKLADMGVKIIVVAPSALARLFSSISEIEEVVLEGMKLPYCDFCVPLSCLPYFVLGLDDSHPHPVPYLQVEDKEFNLIDVKAPGIKVGIVWQSDRLPPENACSLSLLVDSLSFSGVTLYNISTQTDSEQLKQNPDWVIDCGHYLNDLVDRAILINQLDLVITVDSVVAHLAGALGKPVWYLLPRDFDPYWLLEPDTPTAYPTMRLFRQHQLGNWDRVLAEVKTNFYQQFLDGAATTENSLDQTTKQIISLEELIGKTWQFGRLDGSVIATIRLMPDGNIEGVNSPNEASWRFEDEMVVFYHQEGFPSARFNSFIKEEDKWTIAGPFLLGGLHIHTLRECPERLDSEISFEELIDKTWEFGRLDGSVIAIIKLLPSGNIEGTNSPNEASWSWKNKTLVFHHQDGSHSTRFTAFTKDKGKWVLSGLFLLGEPGMHLLKER